MHYRGAVVRRLKVWWRISGVSSAPHKLHLCRGDVLALAGLGVDLGNLRPLVTLCCCRRESWGLVSWSLHH